MFHVTYSVERKVSVDIVAIDSDFLKRAWKGRRKFTSKLVIGEIQTNQFRAGFDRFGYYTTELVVLQIQVVKICELAKSIGKCAVKIVAMQIKRL